MAGRQRLHDGGLGLGGMPHVTDDHVDAAQFHAADQPHRCRAHRHDHLIVDIILREGGGFGRHHADHPERHIAHQNLLAHCLAVSAEQCLAHPLAQQHHLAQIVLVFRLQQRALADRPVQRLREVPGGGAQIGAQRPVAMAHDDAVLVDDRRSLLHVRHLLHGRHIRHRQRLGLPGVGQPFPEDVDRAQPEGLHLGQYLLLRALAHGQHHDDRRHADDDAQQRESGAQPVQSHHPPGRAQDLRQIRQQRQPAPSAQHGQVLRKIPSWRRFSAAPAQRGQVGQVGRGFCRCVCRRLCRCLCRCLGAQPAVFAYRRIGMPDQQAVVGHGPAGRRQRMRFPVDGRSRIPHDPAVSHRDDASRPGRHRRIVGDQDQRVTGSCQLVQLLHHLLAARRIQRSGRLVGQNHPPAVDQCPRNRHPLLLAARELVGQVLQTLRQAQS